MLIENHRIAQEISAKLLLESPPVALAFVETAPTEIQTFDEEVPSACSLWRKAETKVFYAPAEKHFNCPIGAMTMGFDMPDAVQKDLSSLVEKMFGCGYLSPEEPKKIPAVKDQKSGIVYGPLKDFPLEPHLILMWLTPRQAMLYSEAAGTCRWTETSPTALWGRPACAALPAALERSQSTLSLGCMGMRTFTEIAEDRLLVVLPGQEVQTIVNVLPSILEANEAMRQFYEEHKEKFVS